VTLAKASADRTKANRADLEAIVIRTADSASFNAWFPAFTAGNANAERLAAKRMRPGYRPAFNAWLATDPAHNLNAPPRTGVHAAICDPAGGPVQVIRRAGRRRLRGGLRCGFDFGQIHPRRGFPRDCAVLVGTSGHFRIRQARLGLIGMAGVLLVFSVIQLLGLPGRPA
jgi:hypothetical protein